MTATRDYFLRTARLGFGRWAPDDLPHALELWGDARVTRLIGGPFSEAWVHERLEREIATQAARGFQYWPVFRLEDGSFVGCCGLRPAPGEPGSLELGFHLRPEHWGQGYAPEAARAALEYAFAKLGAARIVAGHHPLNEPSRHVLERLGFRATGARHYPPTGLEHPTYALAAGENPADGPGGSGSRRPPDRD
jgi:ribosomal-protein-alanine N-acetyltransferase